MRNFLLAGLLIISGASNAALISSSADSALAGGTVIDFDGAASQSATSLTFGDVTFSTTGGTLRISPFGDGGTGWLGSGQMLNTRDTTSPSSFTINFATAVSAFGMDWGAANPSWNVNLFDSANNLLESLVFVGGNDGATFSEFYGATGSGISRAELTSVSGYDWVIIDDFKYVAGGRQSVPEPGSIVLLGLGLAGLGFSRRRRQA